MLILAGTAFAFYNSVRGLIAGVLFIPLWMRFWDREMQRRRREQFEGEFAGSLQSMAAALETGRSLENAMLETLRALKREGKEGTMIGREFGIMCRQLSVNRTAEDVWKDFADRCSLSEVKEMAMIITAGKRTGGNLIRVLRRSISQTAEKLEVQREIRAVLAARRMELRLMLAMPYAVLLYMRLVFPQMTARLYGNAAGALMMTVCLVLYASAALIGRRIIRRVG